MSTTPDDSIAFLQVAPGRFLVGFGPFSEQASPPARGIAFYRNDFWLSDPRPWKIPSRFEEQSHLPGCRDLAERSVMPVDWDETDPRGFADVFREVQDAITAGTIEKAVPVAVQRGSIQSGTLLDLAGSLHRLPRPLQGYGWLGREESFLGATPELLYSLSGGILKSMALAGTARFDAHRQFRADRKELREHELVARDVASRLSGVGSVRTGRRRLMRIGPLVHFETPIRAVLDREQTANELVRLLHPTPALGPHPRTKRSLELLRVWRDRLGCPGWFGAPFGICRDGALHLVVAIRMVASRGNDLVLPAGCGVLGESRLSREWSEARLKSEAVKSVLGMAPEFDQAPRHPPVMDRTNPHAA